MADEEGIDNAPKGNEWEVVSLTASAYAAAPGPQQIDSSKDSQDKLDIEHDAETSSAMLMSRHFDFPPSQHENLPLDPKFEEIHSEMGIEDDVPQLVEDEGVISDVTFEGLASDEFPGIPIFDDRGNLLSGSGAEKMRKDVNFEGSESIYSSAESGLTKSDIFEVGEGTDVIEPIDSDMNSGFQDSEKMPIEGDEYDGVDLPCEAWWKRRAISIYVHAKEANTFWSICVAAAVMGLVIIGHQWQQERWKVLHLKWQFGITDERMGRMLGPISRFKDVIVGGHRRGSLVRGGISAER